MTTGSQRAIRATVVLIAASFLSIHLLFWVFPNVFEPWNAQIVDQFFILRSDSDLLRPRYDSTIVHVDISDKTFEALENSFLNRFQYAQVVRNLAEMQTALQIWDFIFPARANVEEDSALVVAAASARNVQFGLAFDLSGAADQAGRERRLGRSHQYLEMTKWDILVDGDLEQIPQAVEAKVTFPALAAASNGLGFLNINFDRDGVYRRAPLLVRFRDAFYPSFAFRAACEYLGVTPDRIVLKPGSSVTLKGARRPGGEPHDIVIPVDRAASVVVNYIGPLRQGTRHSMLHYDFAEILRASDDRMELELWGEELGGKIAVVSEVATGASDIGPVPTDIHFPLSGVHSHLLNTILTENFLRELVGVEMLFVEFAIMLLTIWLSLLLSSRNLTVGSIELVVFIFLASAALFLYFNLIVNVLRPVLQVGLAAFAVLAYRYVNEEKEKQALRRSFEAYFPPSVVRKIMKNPESITEAAGQKKELTILFSDIKSFTTHSSKMVPDEVRKLLNEYFEAMVDIVFKYEGTVDKFIGDGLMVFFGDPEPQSDHAVRCVQAAIEMQRRCRELKRRWSEQGRFPLMVRIGINTGPVVVGNMGSKRRLSYTVLGADVNLAQRLEANAPVEGILISHRTYELVKDRIRARAVEPILVKGLEEPIRVYEVPVDK